MKKGFVIITAILCVASLAIGAVAAGIVSEIKAELRPDFTIIIDGEKQVFKNVKGEEVVPILYNGTTYLPIRAIGELMNKKVYWYEDEKTIEFRASETTVTDADVIVPSGSKIFEENSKVVANDDKTTVIKQDFSEKTNVEYIGADKAKEIALEKAGLSAGEVRFDRVELDNERGVWHYEVEFRHGSIEYNADIKADDGKILEWDVDRDD